MRQGTLSFFWKRPNAQRAISDPLLFPAIFNTGYEITSLVHPKDMLQKLPEKPLFSIAASDALELVAFVMNSYQFANVIERSGKGLKVFTALQDYFVHLQIRNIDNFPVLSVRCFFLGSQRN